MIGRANGVGKKLAERIVLERKDKAPAFAGVEPSTAKLGKISFESPCTVTIAWLSTMPRTYYTTSSIILVPPSRTLHHPHQPQLHLGSAPTVRPPGAEWNHGFTLPQLQAHNMELPPPVVLRSGPDWTPVSTITPLPPHLHQRQQGNARDPPPPANLLVAKPETRNVDCRPT